ncbi:lipopolysaccharide biosynthesis protein [Pelomonas sp. CA6]|uniref:lipopolysaccharide biosynthesis protein n=1 Tax=Pelomonas sp. CA6 TaxID=2907999 RepID=UPI001F4C04E0|nr:lipopolysaccharide biosynthesis protein [Pelomonas sp. CA6]MCH7344172.1 lipopolysaccharide biosynthesis protein [Pelomonas sp. CA6]
MSTVRRSLVYTLADSYLGLALQLASTVILSRLLTPEQVGVFAIAAVFAALASTFRDFGVAEYLMQKDPLTEEHIRASTTVNIGVSWTMALLLLVGSPWVSDFYRNPGVGDVMRVQALNFLLIPFGAVTMARFRRELNFQPQFVAGLLSNLLSFAVAVGCAWAGMGHMALAWSSVAGVAITVAVAQYYRPADSPLMPGLKGIADVLHFGKHVSGIYIFGQLGRGAPEMVIGRAEGLAEVALYSRANGLNEIFQRLVMRALLMVCLPYYAQAKRAGQPVGEAYSRSVGYLTAVGWPFFIFTGFGAFAAIRLVYGAQWLASVPLAQVLCLAAALDLVHWMAKEALLANGQASRANMAQFVHQGIYVAALFAVIPFGLMGLCWALVGAALLNLAFNQWLLQRSLGLRLDQLLQACAPSLKVSLAGALLPALWVFAMPLNESNYLHYLLGCGGLSLGMWLLALRSFRHPLWAEVAQAATQIQRRLRPAP